VEAGSFIGASAERNLCHVSSYQECLPCEKQDLDAQSRQSASHFIDGRHWFGAARAGKKFWRSALCEYQSAHRFDGTYYPNGSAVGDGVALIYSLLHRYTHPLLVSEWFLPQGKVFRIYAAFRRNYR
jgi:hypothetical protein